MTLRFRLVVGLGLLLTLGLGVFGFSTYTAYRQSQYRRLDGQLRDTSVVVTRILLDAAGLGNGGPGFNGDGAATSGAGNGGGDGGPRPRFIPGVYALLRSTDGTVLSTLPASGTSTPALASPKLVARSSAYTVGSATGSGDWRVLVVQPADGGGNIVLLAAPTSEVQNSLDRLVLIELLFGGALVVMMLSGSWLVLRRGLRPLETMASSAREISAGDLSQRVSPADGRTEVGQLGLALNTMLDEIETAFDARAATELKLRQFLADASHELRTPLTSIQGFAELFRLGAASDQIDQATMVRRIEEESARMRRLVEDLLLLARLDQTRPVQRAAVDLTVLAADACTDAVATSSGRSVTLDAPQPVVVSGDRDHLRQAIANLVTNALKHTPADAAIEVSARMRGGHAELAVRDHGRGLDDEALAHVFDRFWQADRARVGSGVGLGLSIVAAIAHEHGGTATATNHPDGGAVFTVSLPV